MRKIVEYPTWQEMHLQKKQNNRAFIVAALLLLTAAALLRCLFVDAFLPNGVALEMLADAVQAGEIPLDEAVAAFCREVITSGT